MPRPAPATTMTALRRGGVAAPMPCAPFSCRTEWSEALARGPEVAAQAVASETGFMCGPYHAVVGTKKPRFISHDASIVSCSLGRGHHGATGQRRDGADGSSDGAGVEGADVPRGR